ncbi:MAG: hypothetical protein RI967_1539 [Planctomycetota bacterium]
MNKSVSKSLTRSDAADRSERDVDPGPDRGTARRNDDGPPRAEGRRPLQASAPLDERRRGVRQLPIGAGCDTAFMTLSRLKLPGFCRGGNSRKLSSHCAT